MARRGLASDFDLAVSFEDFGMVSREAKIEHPDGKVVLFAEGSRSTLLPPPSARAARPAPPTSLHPAQGDSFATSCAPPLPRDQGITRATNSYQCRDGTATRAVPHAGLHPSTAPRVCVLLLLQVAELGRRMRDRRPADLVGLAARTQA